MSCYDWENGKIYFSVKEYNKFKKRIINVVKDYHTDQYDKILNIYQDIIKTTKGKRTKWLEIYNEYYENQYHDGLRLIFRNGQDKKPLKPMKKDFMNLNKHKDFWYDEVDNEFNFEFNDKERYIYWNVWNVDKNNHAVDRAHAHEITQGLFSALANITWVRNTGGKIIGNNEGNECNSDNIFEGGGGGGNYVTYSFGNKRRDF